MKSQEAQKLLDQAVDIAHNSFPSKVTTHRVFSRIIAAAVAETAAATATGLKNEFANESAKHPLPGQPDGPRYVSTSGGGESVHSLEEAPPTYNCPPLCPKCMHLHHRNEPCRATDFYRGIVTKIGNMFGDAARTSDDGSVQENVLAIKVMELVGELKKRDEELVVPFPLYSGEPDWYYAGLILGVFCSVVAVCLAVKGAFIAASAAILLAAVWTANSIMEGRARR